MGGGPAVIRTICNNRYLKERLGSATSGGPGGSPLQYICRMPFDGDNNKNLNNRNNNYNNNNNNDTNKRIITLLSESPFPLLKYKLSPNWRPPFLPVSAACGRVSVRRANDAQIIVTVLVRVAINPLLQAGGGGGGGGGGGDCDFCISRLRVTCRMQQLVPLLAAQLRARRDAAQSVVLQPQHVKLEPTGTGTFSINNNNNNNNSAANPSSSPASSVGPSVTWDLSPSSSSSSSSSPPSLHPGAAIPLLASLTLNVGAAVSLPTLRQRHASALKPAPVVVECTCVSPSSSSPAPSSSSPSPPSLSGVSVRLCPAYHGQQIEGGDAVRSKLTMKLLAQP